MKGLESWSREQKGKLRERISQWEGVFGLDPEEAFFAGSGAMPDFRFETGDFSVAEAWWLGELSRLAYTPDHREILRDKEGLLPCRKTLLQERSPFQEVLSIHKTGNHASVYRHRDGQGGTVVCFRGTSKTRQWIMNAVIRPHGWKRFRREGDRTDARVHSGFYLIFKRIRPILAPVLETLPRPWIFTGHSLGGALASIAGVVFRADLVSTFGAPKVGNAAFGELGQAVAVWRMVNGRDLVPRLPPAEAGPVERQLVHGVDAIRLGDGGISGVVGAEKEDRILPLAADLLRPEFEGPPVWLREHRMSAYLDRLRELQPGT